MVKMKILTACEFSRVVAIEFEKKGHDVTSCDLLPAEQPGKHYQRDVRDILYQEWDMIIAFPPCTYLALIGNRWFNQKRYGEKAVERSQKRKDAAEFFMLFANHPCPKICIENPVGIMSTVWKHPRNWKRQIICPTSFGHKIPKRTCLWLKGLPPLMATKKMMPIYRRLKDGRDETPLIYDTVSLPKEERTRIRSLTFTGVAAAMAKGWG